MSGPGAPQCLATPAPGAGAGSEMMVVAKTMGQQGRALRSLTGGFCLGPGGIWGWFLTTMPLTAPAPWSSTGHSHLLHPGTINQAYTLILQLDLFCMYPVPHTCLFSFTQNMYNLVENTGPGPVLSFRHTAIVLTLAKHSFTWKWSGDRSINQVRQKCATGGHLVQTSAERRLVKATSS